MSVPNFVKLADAYGMHGFRIEKAKDLVATMKEHSHPRPGSDPRCDPEGRSRDADDFPGGAMSEMLFGEGFSPVSLLLGEDLR